MHSTQWFLNFFSYYQGKRSPEGPVYNLTETDKLHISQQVAKGMVSKHVKIYTSFGNLRQVMLY